MSWWKRKQAVKKPERRPLRRGLLQVDYEGTGLLNRRETGTGVVEVAEWQRVPAENGHPELSRVTAVRISGVSRERQRQLRDFVPEWVPTRDVRWLP